MKQNWTQPLLLLAVSLAVVCPPTMAAPPEGRGNNGYHQQGDSYGSQGEVPPWQQGNKHDKERKDWKHDQRQRSKYERRDEHGRRYESAGVSERDARRFAYESHLNYDEYRSLPPGIRKNLARGKPLPPGIAKRYVPHDVLVRLPVHPGYEWRVVGTDLVLVAVSTLIVNEILHDVFVH